MNILLLQAHEIAEFDDVRMFHDLGQSVFSIGAYTNPSRPDLTMEHGGRGLRPPLPEVPFHADLAAACESIRASAGDTWDAPTREWMIDPAKGFLHPDVIDWADVIICHHYPERWLVPQWPRLKHKRVIWRTCGQSNPDLERTMSTLHGLEIVRYSPKEQAAFEAMGSFAGQDAMIRFGKYPSDYGPWIGDEEVIGNVTQKLAERGEHCGYPFWLAATEGLATKPAGTHSELIGGTGELSYEGLLDYLRHIRVYLYTGTQPASYTLGLMEAMLTGVPVVSIGPGAMWNPDLFEGHEIVNAFAPDSPLDKAFRHMADGDIWWVRNELDTNGLKDHRMAQYVGELQRQKAIELFDVATVGQQWLTFLGASVPERELAAVGG